VLVVPDVLDKPFRGKDRRKPTMPRRGARRAPCPPLRREESVRKTQWFVRFSFRSALSEDSRAPSRRRIVRKLRQIVRFHRQNSSITIRIVRFTGRFAQFCFAGCFRRPRFAQTSERIVRKRSPEPPLERSWPVGGRAFVRFSRRIVRRKFRLEDVCGSLVQFSGRFAQFSTGGTPCRRRTSISTTIWSTARCARRGSARKGTWSMPASRL